MNIEKQLIDLTCDECHVAYQITKKLYRERIRKKLPNLCKICMKKRSSKKANETKANMLPERKALYSQRLSVSNKKFWEEMDSNIRKVREDQLRKQNNDLQASLTLEDRRKISEKRKNTKNNWSEEKKIIVRKNQSIGQKKRWDAVNDNYKKEFGKLVSNGMSHDGIIRSKTARANWYNSLSKKEQLEYMQACFNGRNNRYNNLTLDDFIKEELKQAINWNNKSNDEKLDNIKEDGTEYQFLQLLEKNNINYEYQYYNIIIHPDFYKLFSFNPYNKSGYTSPFHRWDFMIKLYNKNIFIDIDGSHHDLTKLNYDAYYERLNKNINMADQQLFHDSLRPYQTDNYNAYIVKCYNNKINDNTLVLDIQHNYTIYMETFINRLIREKEELKKRYDIKE